MFKIFSFKLYFLYNFNLTVFEKIDWFLLVSSSIRYNVKLSYKKHYPRMLNNVSYFFLAKTFPIIIKKTTNWNKSRFLFKNFWKKTLKQFFIISFIKIRYKGKGYKLYFKGLKRVYLRFGFSHKNYNYNINNYVRFYVKWVLLSRVIFLGYNWRSLRAATLKLVKKRKANIFTFRGMKLVRQVTVKKTGKISTYF